MLTRNTFLRTADINPHTTTVRYAHQHKRSQALYTNKPVEICLPTHEYSSDQCCKSTFKPVQPQVQLQYAQIMAPYWQLYSLFLHGHLQHFHDSNKPEQCFFKISANQYNPGTVLPGIFKILYHVFKHCTGCPRFS